jgi:hypothetical protein
MRTNKKTDYYELLKKQGLTDAEIADAYILPMELTKEEEEENRRLLTQYRNEQLRKEETKD